MTGIWYYNFQNQNITLDSKCLKHSVYNWANSVALLSSSQPCSVVVPVPTYCECLVLSRNKQDIENVPTFSGWHTVQNLREWTHPSLANLEGQLHTKDKLEGVNFDSSASKTRKLCITHSLEALVVPSCKLWFLLSFFFFLDHIYGVWENHNVKVFDMPGTCLTKNMFITFHEYTPVAQIILCMTFSWM